MDFRKLKQFITQKRILSLLALFILGLALIPELDQVQTRPLFDESYHVTDELAEANLKHLNPFTHSYNFLGHTPGYPWSMSLWLNIFPANYISAKLHALFFSFITLGAFFFFCWLYMSWSMALMASLFLSVSFTFSELTAKCIADTSALFFFILTLFFMAQSKWLSAGLSAVALILFRESGVALPVATLMILPFFYQRYSRNESIKIIKTILPAIILLVVFFLVSKWTTGTAFRHPYATGNLLHATEGFFSWNQAKINTFFSTQEFIMRNLPQFLWGIIPFGLYIFIKKDWSDSQKLTVASFALSVVFYILFFTMYADTLPRDIMPAFSLGIFLCFFSLYHLTPRVGLLIALASISLYTVNRPQVYPNRKVAEKLTLKTAHYIETHHLEEPLCLGWPIDHNVRDEIHGYFNDVSKIKADCHNATVAVINSYYSKSSREKMEKVIKKQNLQLKKEFNIKNEFYHIYEKN